MDSVKINSTISKIVPDILKVLGEEKLEGIEYTTKTNTRIKTHFDISFDLSNNDLLNTVFYARNQIFKNQYKLPMKALFAEPGNTYICQKAPFSGKSNNIRNAAKIIEPLNIGFDEYIRCIPINQNLEEDILFIINVSVPYESNVRFRFKSNQLVCQKELKEIPFDQNIDIGALDIGSEYTGKFKVKPVDLNIYGSYTLFTFNITDEIIENKNEVDSSKVGTLKNVGFDIYTYEFMNVDVKYILKEVIKIVENTTENITNHEFMKHKNDIIKFLNKCLNSLK